MAFHSLPSPTYPQSPMSGVNFARFHGSGRAEDRRNTLSKFFDYLRKESSFLCEDVGEEVSDFFPHTSNAVSEDAAGLSHDLMERDVLDYYAALWHAKRSNESSSDDPSEESYWAFIQPTGKSTWMANVYDYLSGKLLYVERNTKGLSRPVYRQAKVPQSTVNRSRERLPDFMRPDQHHFGSGAHAHFPHTARQPNTPQNRSEERHSSASNNYYSPVAFYTGDSHYSIAKSAALLGIQNFSVVSDEKYQNQCPISHDGQWPDEVPSTDEGAIDVEKLAKLVEFFAARDHPIFVSLNYGSTFKGAYDDVSNVIERLTPIFRDYGLLERVIEEDGSKRTGYWIHVEGGLEAAYMPYLKLANEKGITFSDGSALELGPDLDVGLAVHSIAMDGHRGSPAGIFMTRTKYQMLPSTAPEYIGTPDTTTTGSRFKDFSVPGLSGHKSMVQPGLDHMARTKFRVDLPHPPPKSFWTPDTNKPMGPYPSGIYMTRTKYQMLPPTAPEYIGTPDTTTSGSRFRDFSVPGLAGHSDYTRKDFSAPFMWAQLKLRTLDQQMEKVVDCFETARYIENSLNALGEELKLDLWVARAPAALTVRFKQLNEDLVQTYSLSSESLMVDGELRYYSHVYSTENVTKELVDTLVSDIRALGERAFP